MKSKQVRGVAFLVGEDLCPRHKRPMLAALDNPLEDFCEVCDADKLPPPQVEAPAEAAVQPEAEELSDANKEPQGFSEPPASEPEVLETSSRSRRSRN